MDVNEIDITQLDEGTKAEVRQAMLDTMPRLYVGATTMRAFLRDNISATALVAGMWSNWKGAVEQ